MTQGIAVGDQIRIVRTIRNMGQVELAKRTGLSQFLISYFENGHAAPTHAQMVLIQEALGWPEGAEEAFAILAQPAVMNEIPRVIQSFPDDGSGGV